MRTGEVIITIQESGIVKDSEINNSNHNCDCEDGVPSVDINDVGSDSPNVDVDDEENNVVEF